MKVRCFRTQIRYSMFAMLLVIGFGPVRALAQDHSHSAPAARELSQDQKNKQSALAKVVRDATERFRNVATAENESYHLQFGCVSGPDAGAMGLHYVNMSLALDDELDPARPEIVLYEPLPNGRVRLTGVDFLVLKDAWDAKHPEGPPQLMGQLFHLFEAPNRFGLPAFYTLHVWAWKSNPAGTFSNWNPNVSCDSFGGENR